MIKELCDVMERCYQRGWITTRDGNASFRRQGSKFIHITPSGARKNVLRVEDIIKMSNIAKYNIPSFNQNGFNTVQIMTVIGPVTVKVVSGLINFCHVGNESTYNRLEWIRVGEAFEKEILND